MPCFTGMSFCARMRQTRLHKVDVVPIVAIQFQLYEFPMAIKARGAVPLQQKLPVRAIEQGLERMRWKEQWLREELRTCRGQLSSQIQWGITVLTAAGLNLYYIRKDVYAHLIQLNVIKPEEMLPFARWSVGTIFLLVLAWIFSAITSRLAAHHRAYRKQLLDMANDGFSGIKETVPRSSFLHKTPYVLFFSIPIMDFLAWAMSYAGSRLHIEFLLPW